MKYERPVEVLGAIFCTSYKGGDYKYKHFQIMVTDDYAGVSHRARWNRGISSILIYYDLNIFNLITYSVQDECWSNWGGFSANGNRCYRADCGNPKRGHLVTLQSQHKVEIREFVVLTSECKVSYHKEPLKPLINLSFLKQATNNKPCIFPADLGGFSGISDGYYPACWEKSANSFKCATEVKYDQVS